MVIGNGLFNVWILLQKQPVSVQRCQLQLIQDSFVQADDVSLEVFSLIRLKLGKLNEDLFQLMSVELNDGGISDALNGKGSRHMVVNGRKITDPPVFDRKLQCVFLAFLVDAKRTKAPVLHKEGLVHGLAFLDQNISLGYRFFVGNRMDVCLGISGERYGTFYFAD